MNSRQPPICSQRISVATLSAWRDGDLSAAETDRLRAHVATCAACQQTSADYTTLGHALQRGETAGQLEASRRQERVWRALRARILWQQGGRHMNSNKTLAWRGIGAAVLVLLVAGIGLQLWRGHSSHVAQRPRATATATQRPLDPAIAALPTLTQAWGAHAIAASVPISANSTGDPSFRPDDIAPDGTLVAGYGYAANQTLPTEIDLLTVATGKVQKLAPVMFSTTGFTAVYSTGIVKTDGRYVAWLNQATAGWQINVYDTQRATQKAFKAAQSASETFILVGLDHGQLLWIDQQNGVRKSFALKATDLATQATTDILPQANFSYLNALESWPYVFYIDVSGAPVNPGTVTTSTLYNLTTNKQVAVAATQANNGQVNNGYVLVGTTLYRQAANTNGSVASLEVDQMQHADQAGATWQKLVTVPWADDSTTTTTGLVAASDRLLIFDREYASGPANLIAWDMQQGRFILIDPAVRILADRSSLHGDWLAYVGADTATTFTLRVINTAQLPG